MTEYGCVVSNKFGFAGSDDDDFEDPRELLKKASEAPKPAPVKATPAAVVAKPTKTEKTTKPAAGERPSGDRGRGRGAGRGERGRGAPRAGQEARPTEGADLAQRFGEGSGRARGRDGQHNTRGRGGRGRQFDRHSGSDRTGVRSFEKKEGHGKGNWGDNKDVIAEATEKVPAGSEEETPKVEAPPREKTAEELQYDAEMAEYSKQKTLKEFKAEKQAEASEFKTRKAGEGVLEDFGRLVQLHKTEVETDDEVLVIRKETNKKVIPVAIRYLDKTRSGNKRGDGGNRGRGGAGERGDRAREGRGSYVNTKSAEDFPALQ